MKNDATSQAIFNGSSDVVDLRDRFQGALIGLQLVPTALSSLSGRDPLPSAPDRLRLQQAIDCSIAQTSAFVSAPNTWKPNVAALLPSPTFLLPACVPILLRYQHSWLSRLTRLSALESWIQGSDTRLSVPGAINDEALETFQQALAQVALLGDLIEAIGTGLPSTGWIPWLTERTKAYRRERFLSTPYEQILLAVCEAGQSKRSIGCKTYQEFARGVSSVMMRPESYSLAVRCLGRAAFDFASEEDPESTKRTANAWISTFLAGLLSGASVGKRGLPALWQLRLSAEERSGSVDQLANDLFKLWAGRKP